jgi:hypothetical protein
MRKVKRVLFIVQFVKATLNKASFFRCHKFI